MTTSRTDPTTATAADIQVGDLVIQGNVDYPIGTAIAIGSRTAKTVVVDYVTTPQERALNGVTRRQVRHRLNTKVTITR